MVAVSVRRMRGPSDMRLNPCASSRATSSSVQPPSGPMARTGRHVARGSRLVARASVLSLLFLLPLFAALGVLAARYAPMLNNLSSVVTGNVEMPSTRTSLIILAAGAALTIPLLPLRSMVTAAFVNGLKDSGKP